MDTNINKKNIKSMPYYDFNTEQFKNTDLNNYYYYSKGVSPDELIKITEICDKLELTDLSKEVEGELYRKSRVGYLEFNEENEWIYETLFKKVYEANDEMGWNFQIEGIIDRIEYCEFHDASGYHAWHSDLEEGQHRKISVSLILSTVEEYEGGKSQLFIPPSYTDVPNDINNLIIYPSFIPNRTLPVTSGVKRVLNLWVSGKPFS